MRITESMSAILFLVPSLASGQMLNTTVPVQRIGDSFSNGFWQQSSTRSMSMVAPSLTTTDGYPGSFFSGTVRPFVTGLTPVVSSFRGPGAAIEQQGMARQQAMLHSIATRKLQSKNKKLDGYLRRAQSAEEKGNFKMARANYRLALRKADPILRAEIITKVRNLGRSR